MPFKVPVSVHLIPKVESTSGTVCSLSYFSWVYVIVLYQVRVWPAGVLHTDALPSAKCIFSLGELASSITVKETSCRGGLHRM